MTIYTDKSTVTVSFCPRAADSSMIHFTTLGLPRLSSSSSSPDSVIHIDVSIVEFLINAHHAEMVMPAHACTLHDITCTLHNIIVYSSSCSTKVSVSS